jgi:hypothetical protein
MALRSFLALTVGVAIAFPPAAAVSGEELADFTAARIKR